MKRSGIVTITLLAIVVAIVILFLITDSESRHWLLYSVIFPVWAVTALTWIGFFLYKLNMSMFALRKDLSTHLGSINDIKNQITNLQLTLKDVNNPRPQEGGKRGKVDSGNLPAIPADQIRKIFALLEDIEISIESNTLALNKLKTAKPMEYSNEKETKDSSQSHASSEATRKAATMQTQTSSGAEARSGFSYPASVRDCLRHLSNINADATDIKPESLREGIFTKTTDGIFLMVGDAGKPGLRYFVFPKVETFSTKQDFLTYYQSYFECENPSGGEVWVLKPAVVIIDGSIGELKLTEKGILSVKS